jgi:hypothetical protein
VLRVSVARNSLNSRTSAKSGAGEKPRRDKEDPLKPILQILKNFRRDTCIALPPLVELLLWGTVMSSTVMCSTFLPPNHLFLKMSATIYIGHCRTNYGALIAYFTLTMIR